MAFRMYKSFRNMVASAIVGGDMSNMNPRIWERAVFSAKELTPGTFRNSLRTSIRVRLPPTGQFPKGALIKLIMAECKKLGAKYLFISEFTTTNSNKKSTKNGVLPPPPHLHFPHPPPQRLPELHQITPCQSFLERSLSLCFELDGQVHHAQSHSSKS